MPNPMDQVRRAGANYVMITGSPKFPGILGLPSILQRSGAFEIVRSEGSRGTQGVVLLGILGVVAMCIGRETAVCSPARRSPGADQRTCSPRRADTTGQEGEVSRM